MPQIKANGISLEYEEQGPADAEPVLMIMGLGAQMTRYANLCERMAERGLRSIRFDNRDVGLSERLEAAGAPDMAAIVAAVMKGDPAPVAYTLAEMAADAVGLLDALGIERAHIVGASMGGMIAQLVAADYPKRTLSLTSIMSTSGHPGLPRATPEAMTVLNYRGPDANEDLEAYLDNAVAGSRVIGSPGYPADEAMLRERTRSDVQRGYYPVGFQRQYAAVLASPDRTAKLKTIRAPTVVVHGEADPLVPVQAGRHTAETIPGAELRVIPGMGHDLPPQLSDMIIDAIESVMQRAKAAV